MEKRIEKEKKRMQDEMAREIEDAEKEEEERYLRKIEQMKRELAKSSLGDGGVNNELEIQQYKQELEEELELALQEYKRTLDSQLA